MEINGTTGAGANAAPGESRSGNVPLTKLQMEFLPMGFTATNVNVFGMTGQQIKQLARMGRFPTTNRKRTPGRVLQVAPRYQRLIEDNTIVKDEAGNPILIGYKTIWQTPYKPKEPK